MSRPARRPKAHVGRTEATAVALTMEEPALADWLAERIRRWSLAILGALLVGRAFWPSEANSEAESGVGLSWVFAVMLTAVLAISGSVLSGRLQYRWAWADLAAIGLFVLVGMSASEADDRRTAINLAWQWGGVGVVYVLLRCLPRTRNESLALAGVLVATAVAVSVYAFHQVQFEFPKLHSEYLKNPEPILKAAGVPSEPDNPLRIQFENRLLRSNEPFSTFALANSLAGYLIGPIVLAIAGGLSLFRKPETEDARKQASLLWKGLVPGILPLGLMGLCLILTKSRSAWIGLFVGILIVVFGYRRVISRRVLLAAFAAGVLGLGIAIPWLLSTGRLDREVLTQSRLSLGYRLEYWQGTWGVLTEDQTWWHGLGPGNFRPAYRQHKLVESSEEIADPHNMFLETWATAGLPGLLCLIAALGLNWRSLTGPSRQPKLESAETLSTIPPPPQTTKWLVVCSGVGGLLLVLGLGHLNLFAVDNGDLTRWLLLAVGWLVALILGGTAWRNSRLTGWAFLGATIAMVINLMAAGGIGYASVASMLWGLLALGLNLQDDRACGRERIAPGGRLSVFAVAAFLTALIGIFAGAISPYWNSEAAMHEADEILAKPRLRPEDFERVTRSLQRAAEADVYSTRPWFALAELEFQAWLARGGSFEDRVWSRIDLILSQARKPPRNVHSMEVRKLRAAYARRLLAMPGIPADYAERLRLVEADALYTMAVELHPTSAMLRAEAADALASVGQWSRAAEQAEIALRLDAQIPHEDKKLSPVVRERLQSELPRWRDRGSRARGQAEVEKPSSR